MAPVDWYIEAKCYGGCNCDYNCPCQFEMRPTQGNCRGFEAGRIIKGHFGAINLDGLCYAVTYAWPGAVYEGNGEMQAIIDTRADTDQRKALVTLLHGGETDEAKTTWWVFHAMSSTVHPPLYAEIEHEVDIEARTARVHIRDLLHSEGRPIMSPVNGAPHRVRLDMPEGIEFALAEIGSATTSATGAVALDFRNSYGQFNLLRFNRHGVVRHA